MPITQYQSRAPQIIVFVHSFEAAILSILSSHKTISVSSLFSNGTRTMHYILPIKTDGFKIRFKDVSVSSILTILAVSSLFDISGTATTSSMLRPAGGIIVLFLAAFIFVSPPLRLLAVGSDNSSPLTLCAFTRIQFQTDEVLWNLSPR